MITDEARIYNRNNNPKVEISITDVVEEDTNEEKGKCNKRCLCIFFIIFSIIISAGLIIALPIIFIPKGKKGNNKENEKIEDNQIEQKSPNNQNPLIINREEAMKAFKSNFKINTKTDTLTQLMLISTKNYNTKTDGIESSYSIFTKAKYDIYTLNESLPGKDKDFYSKKYTSVITVNSLCSKFSSSKENDCKLRKYLDLTVKNTNNLRRNDEIDKEKIKKLLLPICIIEHTDTNFILSITCPETLAKTIKNNIILAFQNIKPDSFKGIIEDNNIAGTTIERKDNKIYINLFDRICNDYDGDPSVNMTCETTRNIITDNDGNLILSKQISKSETIKDKDNKISNDFIYTFEDVSKQNSDDFDPQNYKSNLKIVFDLTNSLMKKENYISEGSFEEILEDLMRKDNSTDNSLRQLFNLDSENAGVKEESVFSKNFYNINMTLNLKNDIGLGEREYAKAITNYNTGEESNEISNTKKNINLFEILNQFITLSKAGNKLASSLYEELNDPLLNLRDKINTYINDLNNLLAFKQLAAIFDSTLASQHLEKLPYTFVAAAHNLYKGLEDLNNDISYIISNTKKQLKNDVSNFLYDSHDLLENIFKNLTEATNSLSSKKSKIAEISSYYLNDTDTSYIDTIKKAREILDNYYKNEKELIEPLVDDIINDFPNKVMFDPLKNIQSSLDNILSRIESGSLLINLASNEDYKNVIKNLYNSNIKLNEIIKNVQQKIKESIRIQSNGYFETQKELEQNKKSYGGICEKAINISYALDNNELIDKKFDEIMIYFREQFVFLLNYMEKSKREKFTVKNDVLISTIFDSSYINQIDTKFKDEELKILNFIKNENNQYLEAVNEKINSDKLQNENNLEQLINNIQVELSDLNLNNLEIKFNEALSITINSINTLIENNYKKANQYLNDVIKAGSIHRTQAFVDKYNVYINSFFQIRSYIQNNLKSNLASKYKNVINQVRINLQSIKSSEIIKKYFNYLPFAENHLRIIETLFERLDKHISDKIFNNEFLPIINDYINSQNNNLNNKIENLKNLFNSQLHLSYSSNTNYDYYKSQPFYYFCCIKRKKWFNCVKKGLCWIFYNDVGYTVGSTKSHLSLESINFNKYINNFDSLYNSFYKKFENLTTSYNDFLIQLDSPLESLKQEILNKSNNSNYLNEIDEYIKSIINDKLGYNLLESSYNYYKNEINEKLPIELNDILEKWSDVSDKIYEKLNSNVKVIKSSLNDFTLISAIYYNMYSQNITYDYSDSIVNIFKNDFNYTIKYYYDLILSKVQKVYSYILNNIPSNEKPFDEILIKRTNEIKNLYNSLINQIQTSKDEVLKLQKQLNFLKVNEKNFFLINSYITENVESINQLRENKLSLFKTLVSKNIKRNTEELLVSRFYLENSQNGKQIKEIYDSVNKATFIDLYNNGFQKLIEDNWEIEYDEFIKNIKNVLTNSNEKILNNFKYEKEEYIKKLQNKIYEELYSKEDLDKQINLIYSNGLKDLDSNSKNLIYEYLKEALNKIKSHISNEANRLNSELSSQCNNYKLIEERLNNYKKTIFDQFYSTILSVINDFYSNVTKKFYKDYIEKNLNEYKTMTNKQTFKEFKFLNVSLNLKEIVNKNLEIILNEYKNLTMTQINYLNQQNLQTLNNLFDFTNLKNTINNEIDNIYNSILLPILKSKAIYNSRCTDYDLSDTIINDINTFINEKIIQTKQIIEKMKGNNYLDENFNIPPDFSLVSKDIFEPIKASFDKFTEANKNQEIEEFNGELLQNAKNNFKIFINNFVPNYGKNFFDRILKYNEIQKIKSLFYLLKYSLAQSTIYYVTLCQMELKTGSKIRFPKDIKLKILTLNNLDSTIKSKNNQIISTLITKLNKFIEDTKNYIVEKYFEQMKNNPFIDLNFNSNIKYKIEQILAGKRYIFENEYINIMNTYIKNPFVEEYTRIINEEANNINFLMQKSIEETKIDLNKIFSLDIDNVLSDIENKLNNTLIAVNTYSSHFDTFKISDDVIQFLDNYGKDIIYPKYLEIKKILDENTKDIVFQNLEKNSDDFIKEYSIEKFENKAKEININLNNSFYQINDSLKKYGYKDEIYEENLQKEINNYERIRRLDELDNEKMIYNQKSADYKLDKTLQELKNSSLSIKEFIQSLNLFSNFNDKINKYINDINYQYGISENLIKKDTQNYDELSMKLYELKSYSLNYFEKANSTYHKMKKDIINYIFEIDELIENCSNITYNTISNKYIDIKNKFNSIKDITNGIKEQNPEYIYEEPRQEESYTINTIFENFLIQNEITLDIVFEEGDIKKPIVIGKVINKNKPEKIKIDFSSDLVGYVKDVKKIEVFLNNISLSTDIKFIGGLCEAKLKTIFNFDEYKIKILSYQEFQFNNDFSPIFGIILEDFGYSSENETQKEEKEEKEEEEIVPSKLKIINETYTY